MAQGALVEQVADDAQGENGAGQEVARSLGLTSEEAGEDLVVVFYRRADVSGSRPGEQRGRDSRERRTTLSRDDAAPTTLAREPNEAQPSPGALAGHHLLPEGRIERDRTGRDCERVGVSVVRSFCRAKRPRFFGEQAEEKKTNERKKRKGEGRGVRTQEARLAEVDQLGQLDRRHGERRRR